MSAYLLLAALLSTSVARAYVLVGRSGPTCSTSVPVSCSSATLPSGVDKCCFETPGGALLLTQFWDYSPALGPTDEFTLHGLWPDNCDGTYESSCDATLNVNGTLQSIIVGQFGDSALYNTMSTSWKGINGDEYLWSHEWDKHGTCINTINPSCYTGAPANQNIYDFFRIAVALHQTVPTYKFLVAEGITPSSSATYTKQQIQDALDKHFGHTVYFDCDSSNAINQIWYFHHLQGSLLGQQFIPIDSLSTGSCPSTGIKFPPKSGTTTTATTTTTTSSTKATSSTTATSTSTGGSTSTTVPASGYVKAGSNSGCLITSGKYYESGTCATFKFAAVTGGITLTTSKGACTVSNSTLTCASGTTAGTFSYSAGTIGYGGVYDWCFGASSGSPAQTAVVLNENSACDGSTTFNLTA